MTEDTLPTGGSPAASTMGARLWRRMLGWVRRYRLIRNLEISLAILALIVGTLTYLAMTPGANQDLTAREVQVLLPTDLVVLLGLTTMVARRLVHLWMQRRRRGAGWRLPDRKRVELGERVAGSAEL